MTTMTANKRYFGRGHGRRWGTSGAVDVFGSCPARGGIWRQHALKRLAASEKCLPLRATNGPRTSEDLEFPENYFEVVTSLEAGVAARCSARLSCSTCWVQSAISSSRALILRASRKFFWSLC